MNEEEVSLSMSLPLDSDGFLRRECPTCEREFKWLPSDEEDAEPVQPQDGGYFCPYCGVQAPEGSWLTKAQVELAENLVAREVIGPLMKDFDRDLRRGTRGSDGLLRMSVSYDPPEAMTPLVDDDDLERIDFACHPSEPLKISESWDRPAHCLVCGQSS